MHGFLHVVVALHERLHGLVPREAHLHDLLHVGLVVLALRHFRLVLGVVSGLAGLVGHVGGAGHQVIFVRGGLAGEPAEEAALARDPRGLLLQRVSLLGLAGVLLALLLQEGRVLPALAYVGTSVLLCLAGAWLGMMLMRAL